jgi:hypothetical protein
MDSFLLSQFDRKYMSVTLNQEQKGRIKGKKKVSMNLNFS